MSRPAPRNRPNDVRPTTAAGSPSGHWRPLHSDRVLAALIAILTIVALSPVLGADFSNWDDPQTIARHPLLNPPTWAGWAAFWNPNNAQMSLYVPMTYTVWSLVASVAYVSVPDPNGVHLNPTLFHALNLGLHVTAALVAFALLKRLTRSSPAAAAGALLFALHPVQAESVGWASGTKDVLWGLLGLTALLQYVRFAEAANAGRLEESDDSKPDPAGESEPRRLDYERVKPAAATSTRGRVHYAIATIALVLAMLSKPTAVVLPFVAVAIDLLLLRRPWRRALVALLPWMLLTIPVLIEGKRAQPAVRSTGHAVPLVLRPALAADAVAFYARKVVWPGKSGIVYDRSPPAVLAAGTHRTAWVVPLALAGTALFALRRRRTTWPAASLAIFVFGVGPVLGFVPFEFQGYSTVSDHYLYFSMLGPAMALAFALSRQTRSAIPYAACGFALLGLACLAFAQARTWRDSITLLEHAVRVNPNEIALRANLSTAYHEANRPGDAVGVDEETAKRWPASVDAHVNFASSLARIGRLDEAEAHAAEALRLDRGSMLAWLALENIQNARAAARAAGTRKR